MNRRSESSRRVRNPFYDRVVATGIHIITPVEPLPHGRRAPSNPYYELVGGSGGVILAPRRGRPRAGEDRPPTKVSSLRLPAAVWRRLDQKASRRKISRADAIREAIGRWLDASA